MQKIHRKKVGQFQNSIAKLELGERTLQENTLILGETNSGKTYLSNIIREHVIDNDIPTLYLDFSNAKEADIEEKFKTSGHFHYMRFDESDAFDAAFDQAVSERKDIYMAVDPNYFSGQKEIKSKLSQLLQKEQLLKNYYYFMHVISALDSFFTQFQDFILYIFQLIQLKKFGLTFLTQPNTIFEDSRVKLLFSFLYIGRCSEAYYYNASLLRSLPTRMFYYQERTDERTLLFNNIRGDIVKIYD